jgi:arylsulfatase A-like enzyme
MEHRDSRAFAQDHVRERVLPAYMGLIKQIDDQMGVLFRFLKDEGLWDDTLIVFTSDHGDYLGDHWLGEKELFHDCSVRIPLIVRDPRTTADPARGTVSGDLIEAIDLVPTFLDYAGGTPQLHRLEGVSLKPLMEGGPGPARDHVVSEMDYSRRDASRTLGLGPQEARTWMVRSRRWKYIHHACFAPQLFDLEADSQELTDLGLDPAYAPVCAEMKDRLLAWSLTRKSRTTISDERILQMRDGEDNSSILIGWWDENG